MRSRPLRLSLGAITCGGCAAHAGDRYVAALPVFSGAETRGQHRSAARRAEDTKDANNDRNHDGWTNLEEWLADLVR